MLALLKRSRTSRVLALTRALRLALIALVVFPCAGRGAFPHPVLAQQEDSDEANSPTYLVKGIVVNSVTHQPVARALVDAHESAVLTDNDGHFEFSLPQGMVQISVKRPGYGSRGRASTHTVQVGPNMPSLTFNLTPEAMITGQVTLSTSDPADGIQVMAYRRRVINGRQQWMIENSARTNSEGIFRIAGLHGGDYLIYTQPARDSEGPQAGSATIYGYPAVYYPGVTDVASAGVLTVGAGQQGRADFVLARQQFYHVTVTVAGREGSGLNLQVHDNSGRQMGLPVRWNNEQGTAEMNLPNGSYFLEARRRRENQLYGRVDFTVAGAPITRLTMALTTLHPIPVTVRKNFNATSNAGGGIAYSAIAGGPPSMSAGLNISLLPVDEAFRQWSRTGGLRAVDGANDGSSFELENVSPGRYWVEASAFEGYVSSISSGGVDLAREPLGVGAGGSSAPIEVTLRDDAATISAQLIGDPGADAHTANATGDQQQIFVYAIPLFPSTGSIRISGMQGPGQVMLPGLAPGSYRVIAVDSPQEIDFHTPEGLAKYATMGVTTDSGRRRNCQRAA